MVQPPNQVPIFIHLSTHGAHGKGLSLGQDEVEWQRLSEMLLRTLEGMDFNGNGYPGPTILVISACSSEKQTLTRCLSRAFRNGKLSSPPSYIFLISDENVYWADAVVTWTLFYRMVRDVDFRVGKGNRKIKEFVRKLKCANFGNLAYFRWHPKKRKYYRYPKRAN